VPRSILSSRSGQMSEDRDAACYRRRIDRAGALRIGPKPAQCQGGLRARHVSDAQSITSRGYCFKRHAAWVFRQCGLSVACTRCPITREERMRIASSSSEGTLARMPLSERCCEQIRSVCGTTRCRASVSGPDTPMCLQALREQLLESSH